MVVGLYPIRLFTYLQKHRNIKVETVLELNIHPSGVFLPFKKSEIF